MRLICPNCGAQYEVDDSIIPDAGRDVQCSGCGQTWFQPSRTMIEAEAEEVEEANLAAPEGWEISEAEAALPEEAPPPAPEPEAPAEAAPETMAPADDTDLDRALAEMLATADPPPPATAEDPVAPAPSPGAVPRRPLDDSLLSILREEAEREAAARRMESTSLETQEEMNLEPAPAAAAAKLTKVQSRAEAPPAAPAPSVAARRRANLDFSDLSADYEEDEFAADITEGPLPGQPGGAGSRRQRLPDIEEINSSLRGIADRGREAAALGAGRRQGEGRSGFRLSFLLVILAAASAGSLYLYAPQIAARLPAMAPWLEQYVEAVNLGRGWFDTQLQQLIEQLRG